MRRGSLFVTRQIAGRNPYNKSSNWLSVFPYRCFFCFFFGYHWFRIVLCSRPCRAKT